MADIFGNRPEDYSLVRALHEEGTWDAYQAGIFERARQTGLQIANRHDFQVTGQSNREIRAEIDGGGIGFLTNNLLAIQTMVDEIIYTAYRLPMWVPLNMSIPEGASEYGVRVVDRRGQAEEISGPGYEAPSATASQTLVPHGIHWYGLDGEWSVDELRGAQYGGFPLDTYTLRAAVMGSLEKMEQVALTGPTKRPGVMGLLNQTSGDNGIVSAVTAWDFDGAATTTVREEINKILSAIIQNSMEAIGRELNMGMTLYLPPELYDRLNSIYLGDDPRLLLMRVIKESNPWSEFSGQPLMIERVLELASAGAGRRGRGVCALKHSRVFEMGVSIMPRVLRIMDKGRVICAQVESKYSDIFLKRPKDIIYFDETA